MLFQGSEDVGSNEHFEIIQRAGGTLNGSTWLERTNYFETVPSNHLEVVLWLEANRMGKLLPAMTQQKLDTQRDVVKNERRWSMDNQPYGTWWEKLPALCFPAGPSVPPLADRLDGGPRRGEPRGRSQFLRNLLHARQRRPHDRGRFRSRTGARLGGKALRADSERKRPPADPGQRDAERVRCVEARGGAGPGSSAPPVPRVPVAGVRQPPVLRRKRLRGDSRDEEREPPLPDAGARPPGGSGNTGLHV